MRFVDYYKPASINEVLQLLNKFSRTKQKCKAKLLAGGTDLIPKMKDNIDYPEVIVEITDINELHGIELRNNRIVIKAATTFAEIEESEVLNEKVPILVSACRQIGSVQIRSRATIGGNLVNASPAGDSIPPLYVLAAQLHLCSLSNGKRNERIVPVQEFFTAPGQTVLQPDELLTEISFPLPEPESKGAFIKLGQRRAMAISKVSIALLAKLNSGRIDWIRIALGAVAPTVLRAHNTEAFLMNKAINNSRAIEEAMGIIREEVSPIDDIRSYGWYRREMCSVLLRRALASIKH